MLEPAELAELEATLLPALERHQLRLLAHGLRTLQAIAGRRHGACPDTDAVARWCAAQPLIAEDPGFVRAFADRLADNAALLETIAAAAASTPLELSLADLARWAVRTADARIAAGFSPQPPNAPQPPG